MAYTFSVNNTPTTGAVAMYTLISTLMSAGWLKKMDSDGTTYSSTGAQVTSGNTGTNGLGNNNAWVRLQSPPTNGGTVTNQTRELTIQRGTTDLVWRIKYSASALFTGGSPAATVTSSSTDEVFMIGGGTDASPTFGTLFSANTSYRWHVVAGGSTEFYSFIAWAASIGGANGSAMIGLDVLASGTYPSSDVDPAVVIVDNASIMFNSIFSNAGFGVSNVTNPAIARGWMGATSAAGASLTSNNVNMTMIGHSFAKTGTIMSNPWTFNLDLFPLMWGSGFSTAKGIKGFSTLFKYSNYTRNNMITGDIASANARDTICIGSVWVPWNGSFPAY